MIIKITLLALYLCLALGAWAQPCKKIVGYYPNWQWYDRAKLVRPETIKYEKYTHLNYAFFRPETDGSIVETDSWADDILLFGEINWSTDPPGRIPNTSIVELAHNAGVKILPSVGGWTLSNNFPSIAADPEKRKNFAHNCVLLIKKYKFDGIDIDWEHPGYAPNGGTPADKANCTLFLREIRDSLDALGELNQTHYLLTEAIGSSPEVMQNFEWNEVAPLLDIINLMSYDFFGAWDAAANHNSPLFAPAQGDTTFNLASATRRLTDVYGIAPEKICAGVAFYGRSAVTNGTPALFAPLTGQVDGGTFSADEGSPLYYNIVDKFPLFDYKWDDVAKVPYLLGKNNLNTFVSFDDERSIAEKAKFIVEKNIGGAIIWEITGDYIESAPGSGIISATPLADTLNQVFCYGLITHKNPLLNKISDKIRISFKDGHIKVLAIDNSIFPAEIEILDARGTSVYTQKISQTTRELQTPALANGLYFVNFKNNTTFIYKKILVN